MPMSTLFMTESSLPLSNVGFYITISLTSYMAVISLNCVAKFMSVFLVTL